MDADPQTGVTVVDTYAGGTFEVGGTSLATPMWAALIAIVNQGRAMRGQSSLDGVSQTLPMLYNLPSTDFHDITTGDNGYPATIGYDPDTGRGTPIANLLVPALAGFPGTAVWTGLQSNDWYNGNNWNTFSVPNSSTNVIINFGNPTAATAFNIAGLSINGGVLQLGAGGGAYDVTALSIVGNGTIDMTSDRLFIDFGSAIDPISTIAGYLQAGYNAGAWNGKGIDSSAAAANPAYALGYADGADGIVSGLTSGQIEIIYTLYGDANLDGEVNAADMAILATNFNQGGASWDQGDFNYDGQVNAADFSLLAQNFNQSVTLAAVANAPAAAAPAVASTTPTVTTSTIKTTAATTPVFSAILPFPRVINAPTAPAPAAPKSKPVSADIRGQRCDGSIRWLDSDFAEHQ
jgi:hypothetical protein